MQQSHNNVLRDTKQKGIPTKKVGKLLSRTNIFARTIENTVEMA